MQEHQKVNIYVEECSLLRHYINLCYILQSLLRSLNVLLEYRSFNMFFFFLE